MKEHSHPPTPLELEKRKDYRNAVISQVCILVLMLTMKDVLELAGYTDIPDATWGLFLLGMGWYLYLLWDMLRNFTRSRPVVWTIGLVVLFDFGANLVLNGLLGGHALPHDRVNLVLYGVGLLVQLVVIGYAMRDLFQSPRNTVDKLWGSACLYFMSGFAFAALYHMIHLAAPLAYGVPMAADYVGLTEALYFSFNCLVGLDNAYDHPIHLMRNAAVLEGCWGQLYLVLLIGRVLMPPEGEEDSSAAA